jgi:hypothetical protein
MAGKPDSAARSIEFMASVHSGAAVEYFLTLEFQPVGVP